MKKITTVATRPGLTGLILILALLLAACTPAGAPAADQSAQVESTGQATRAVGSNLGLATNTQVPASTQVPTSTQAGVANTVQVSEQALVNDTVTVALVTSAGPGWLVIHADNGGSPGAILGYSAVQAGENRDVVVQVDLSQATPVLYAMLHVDAGVVGTYEFPGADAPALDESGQMVTPAFAVTGGLAPLSNDNANDNLNSNANDNQNSNSNDNQNGNDDKKPDY